MADKKISQLPAATTPLAGTEVLPIVQSSTTDQVSVANLTAGRAVSAASLTLTSSPLPIASGGTNQTAFTAPASSIAGLVWFDGTSFQNDATTSHVGYNASTNVFYANTPTFSGNTTLSTGNLVIGTSGKGIDFSATAGTGTSELLADYEEGTWTPAASYSTSNGDLSHSVQVGKYIKVGNLVTVTGYINFSETTASGNLSITGLPYTSANVTNAYSGGELRPNNLTGCTDGTLWTIAPNATVMTITYANAGNPANVTNTNTGAGSSFYFSCSYQTA